MKNRKQRCISEELSVELLGEMAQVLKLLAHPHRLKIIEILESTDGAPVHVVVEKLGLGQAATSQHLNQMKRLGLIAAERRGKEVWYSISDNRSLKILDCIRQRRSGK